MQIVIPGLGPDPMAIDAPVVEVWIAGVRRTDGVCQGIEMQSGPAFGSAVITFPRAGYDSKLCLENDLVEIKIAPIGVVWRGYISARDAQLNGTSYTALDFGCKWDDCLFWRNEYNDRDEVTGETQHVATSREIATAALAEYEAWAADRMPNDYPVGIALESFPATNPGTTSLVGLGLLAGLDQVLRAIDYRWRLRVKHDDAGTTISAFYLGLGDQKPIVRGSEPSLPYHEQPEGVALVAAARHGVNAANAITEYFAQGDRRIIESSFIVDPDWNEVADDYTPGEGHTLKEYVTESERHACMENPEKYLKPTIDIKSMDGFAVEATNINYRKKFETVCRRWKIRKYDDRYYFNDDAENYPELLGDTEKQVRIEAALVQTWGEGGELRPFIIFKRTGDDTLYVKFDGFTIKDSQWVEFSEPFMDETNAIAAAGVSGSYVSASHDPEENTSQYEIENEDSDLTELVTEGMITVGAWLWIGDIPAPFRIVSVDDEQTLTVMGNLSGESESIDMTQWMVGLQSPFMETGGWGHEGVGGLAGYYETDPEFVGPVIETNEYAGMYLLLGGFEDVDLDGTGDVADLKAYRIVSSTAKSVQIAGDTDLSAAAADWRIVQLKRTIPRMYEWINLEAAWRSGQRLQWLTAALSELRNRRCIYKQNNDFEWHSLWKYYRLTRSVETGHEDEFTAEFVDTDAEDIRKDLDELIAWADVQIAGADAPVETYIVTLCPMDLTIGIGDRLVDNGRVTSATVMGMRLDFGSMSQELQAASADV